MGARLIVAGVVATLLAVTPLLPVAVVLAVVVLLRSKNDPPGAARSWGRLLCGPALGVAVVMTPLYLMFLDDAGLLRR